MWHALALVLSLASTTHPSLHPSTAASAAMLQDTQPVSEADAACDALVKEFDALEHAFYDSLGKAKTDEERSRIVESGRPDAKAFVERFRAIADRWPKTDAAARSLAWIVLHARGEDAAKDALGRLVRDHIASDALADVCYDLSFESDAYVGDALARIAKDAPGEKVRGRALYSLAKHRQRVARMCARLRDGSDPEARKVTVASMDEKRVAELEALDPKQLDREAEELLERVAKEYADVELFDKKLGRWATGDLFELRELALGKVAPDIEGADVDGARFHLGDYRGKVVVLDFWGNW